MRITIVPTGRVGHEFEGAPLRTKAIGRDVQLSVNKLYTLGKRSGQGKDDPPCL